ncbi:MAG: hypothetical protein ACW97Z_11515 [Candidatus Hodarchaeales archaeon]
MTELNNENSLENLIYVLGGIASLSIAVIFFFALIELMTNTFELFQQNFVIRLIKQHAEYSESIEELLSVINLLDMSILVLVSITALALYPVLKDINKSVAIIAVAQPFLGIILFLVTQEIGRTATFSTALTISAILLWNDRSDKVALLGVLSASLILIPDISFMFVYSKLMAIIMSAGYLLFIPWWFLISLTLFHHENNFKRFFIS